MHIDSMRIFSAILILLILSCRNNQDKDLLKNKSLSSDVSHPYLPNSVDSIDVLYFKKPFQDKERYQRYFTHLNTRDSLLISYLRVNLQKSFSLLVNAKDCNSEGKIIVPLKGDAFKIIYFSRLHTNCPYLYVIENGSFRYYEMDSIVHKQLNFLEPFAKDPT